MNRLKKEVAARVQANQIRDSFWQDFEEALDARNVPRQTFLEALEDLKEDCEKRIVGVQSEIDSLRVAPPFVEFSGGE